MDAGGSIKTIIEDWSWWLTWIWILGLSAWGGAVSYFHHMDKHGLPFSLMRLAMDVFTSAFVGVLTYLLCHEAGISDGVTAAMVGISGHMGTRALFVLERKYEQFFAAAIPATERPVCQLESEKES